jgi:hypothetical protein
MLLRAQFRNLVAEQLKLAQTAAGASVYKNRALPSTPDLLPMITLSTPAERKASEGRGPPKFTTTIHLKVDARVTGLTDEVAGDALDALVEQIEMAILANRAVVNVCQQFTAVETTSSIDATGGTVIATATIVFQAEIYQVYDPATPDRLLEVQVSGSMTTVSAPALDIKF